MPPSASGLLLKSSRGNCNLQLAESDCKANITYCSLISATDQAIHGKENSRDSWKDITQIAEDIQSIQTSTSKKTNILFEQKK